MALRGNPMEISKILKEYQADNPKGLPPVHLWNPPFCGDLDMRIARNGQWYYMGTPIGRKPLYKLFSTVLRRDEDDSYYLVTPVEKVRIQVDDAPFVAILVDRSVEEGVPSLRFTTQTDDEIVAGPDHRLWVQTDPETGEPAPYLHVRARLHALISRNVFYQLVEWGEERVIDGRHVLGVASGGEFFVISEL